MQHRLQIQQGLTTDCRQCRQLHSATNRRIEHPLRDLQESTFEALFYATEEQSMPIPGKGTVDRHHAVVPRMPRVTDFSRFSTMGVALSTCTTRTEPISVWGRHARGACCSIGISEREQDYLDAATRWVASPLRCSGLSQLLAKEQDSPMTFKATNSHVRIAIPLSKLRVAPAGSHATLHSPANAHPLKVVAGKRNLLIS